jgi:hypothetical protein
MNLGGLPRVHVCREDSFAVLLDGHIRYLKKKGIDSECFLVKSRMSLERAAGMHLRHGWLKKLMQRLNSRTAWVIW